MKVSGACEAVMIPQKGVVWLKPNPADLQVFMRFFSTKAKKEERFEKKILPVVTLDLPAEGRTFKQNNTLWALITIIFVSMNGKKPTAEEKQELYLDILEEYADRVPTRFTHRLRPIHMSESDTVHAAKLIQACFDILRDYCDLNMDLQADVRTLFWEWHRWRGGLERDPLDYDEETEKAVDEGEWRASHMVSDASGVGGAIEKAHIVSRGADAQDIDEPWNWLALLPEEHRFLQHQNGWAAFLEKFPHLEGRVKRARELAASRYGNR